MSNRLEAKRTALLDKNEALTKLLAGGNDLTSDELKAAGDLQAEVRSLKSAYDQYASLEATAEEVKALADKPAKPFVMGGVQPGTKSAAHYDPKTGEFVAEDESIKGISPSILAAISGTGYREAYRDYLAKGRDGMAATNYKVLQDGIDSAGGFLVPEEIQRRLIMKKPTPTNIASHVTRYQTSRDSLSIPKVIYNTDDIYQTAVRLTKTGEIPTTDTVHQITDPVFGQVRIDVYTHMASGQLTNDLIEDSMFDLAGFLAGQMGTAKDILTDYYILLGTGQGQPTGILANPGGSLGNQLQPATVAIGSPLAADGIMRMAYSLPPQYDDNAMFVFNKTNTELGIAQLKTSTNAYLFSVGQQDQNLASARPTALVGYPILRSQLMPNAYSDVLATTANANAFPIIFGDLTGYAMIERVGLSITVLDQTRAKSNQIEILGRWRFGSQTLEEWKLKVGKVSAS